MRELVRHGPLFGSAAFATLLAASGCGSGSDAATVNVLARADGWRDGLYEAAGSPYVLIEVAADRARAERAWSENVPEALPRTGGEPAEPGIYGALADVDFEREAVVVYSSGASGTCPAWVGDLATTDGRVEVTLRSAADAAQACTDDYHPYRLVLAVDREALPAPGALPVEEIDVPSENLTGVAGRVVAYPYSNGAGEGTQAAGCLGPDEPFDRDEARDRAQALLGVPEDAIPESGSVRIARRGDERRALTMDLRPGRCNVELDDDGANRFRVTRVEVEVPSGEDPLVVE